MHSRGYARSPTVHYIGRRLLPLLLARGGEVGILVRPGSGARFAGLRDRLDPEGTRLFAIAGDITEPGLGVSAEDRRRLRGVSVFHLAAIYNLSATSEEAERANVHGTRHLVDLANDIETRMKQGFSVFVMNWGPPGFEAVQIGRRISSR